LQNIGAEMVIAIPLALFIERNNQQVGAFEILQGFLPGKGGFGQNGVTKGTAQPVKG